jgi:hypothetical protein
MGVRQHAELGEGQHTLSFGALWDHTQLNIVNDNTNTDVIDFKTFLNFVEGAVRTGYRFGGFHRLGEPVLPLRYRGTFVNDNYKVRSNLTVTLGCAGTTMDP